MLYYPSVCIGCQPVNKDVCCWRWYIKKFDYWTFIGISQPHKYQNNSYKQEKVYGIGPKNYGAFNGEKINVEGTNKMFIKPSSSRGSQRYANDIIKIDMLYDATKYGLFAELTFFSLNFGKKHRKAIILTQIPFAKDGYVPHCNFSADFNDYGTQVVVARIPLKCFGKLPHEMDGSINKQGLLVNPFSLV